MRAIVIVITGHFTEPANRSWVPQHAGRFAEARLRQHLHDTTLEDDLVVDLNTTILSQRLVRASPILDEFQVQYSLP